MDRLPKVIEDGSQKPFTLHLLQHRCQTCQSKAQKDLMESLEMQLHIVDARTQADSVDFKHIKHDAAVLYMNAY